MESRLETREKEVRGGRLEARDWMLGTRGWRLEVGSWILDVRWWRLEIRSWILEARKLWLSKTLSSNFYLLTSILIFLFISFVQETNAQTLDDYFKIALENNPELQSKYKEFESALQKIPQAKALPDPTFSVSALGQMTQTRTGQQMAIFSLSQMFPWFGTLKAQGDVYALMAEAKHQAFLDTRNILCYQVSAAYYPLYELNKWMIIEQENIQILESYKSIATIKFQNGMSSMVDVLRVDIMLKEASTNLSILKQKKRPFETRFNMLLSRNATAVIAIADSLELPQIANDYRRDSLLINNPLLTELDLKIKANEVSEKVAIKQGMPKLGVGFQYISVAQRTDANLPQNGQDAFMPMFTMSLPIFRAKYKAAQKEAQLMQASFTLKKQAVNNSLISNYEMTLFEIQKQNNLLHLYDQQIIESQQSLNLLFTGYGNSGKDFEEVLRMQQQLLKYQKMKATAMTEYQIALAELDYITAKSK
ncbi:MAG: cobalt-zinc-cadmium efflux system outer membrane protein [Cyclobacteriaceae bacterium]